MSQSNTKIRRKKIKNPEVCLNSKFVSESRLRKDGSWSKGSTRSKQGLYGTVQKKMSRTTQTKGKLYDSSILIWGKALFLHGTLVQIMLQLRDMKCSIDNRSPRQATHLRTKAKKNALMEDRIDQIETENRILLEKMSNIMKVSSASIGSYTISTRILNTYLVLKVQRWNCEQK